MKEGLWPQATAGTLYVLFMVVGAWALPEVPFLVWIVFGFAIANVGGMLGFAAYLLVESSFSKQAGRDD